MACGPAIGNGLSSSYWWPQTRIKASRIYASVIESTWKLTQRVELLSIGNFESPVTQNNYELAPPLFPFLNIFCSFNHCDINFDGQPAQAMQWCAQTLLLNFVYSYGTSDEYFKYESYSIGVATYHGTSDVKKSGIRVSWLVLLKIVHENYQVIG